MSELRKTIFKGQRKDNKGWARGYPYPAISKDAGEWLITVVADDLGSSHTYSIYPETLRQFTGSYCYDEKSRHIELYEGDIVSVTVFDREGHDTQYICQIEWIRGSFVVSEIDKSDSLETDGFFDFLFNFDDTESDFTYLGNIFDNPELLEAD